jgi:putative ABC transport system permease protein
MQREPVRTLLTILAISLGVAVVLAIEMAGDAAAGSFRSSMDTLTTDADWEVTAAGGVPDAIAGLIATQPLPLETRPRIEDYATIVATGQTVPLIGLDLPPASSREGVWVSKGLAQNRVRLLINDTTVDFEILGVLNEATEPVIVMDIALAQRVLDRRGRIDRILVKGPKPALPDGVTIAAYGNRTAENKQMLEAFRWNLRVLSYIALVVGAFLIYNTISVSVVRRRAEIGVFRALGAARWMVMAGFFGEALFFGILGALGGIVLGRLLAVGAVQLLAATVQKLYVSSTPAQIALSESQVVLAFAIGPGVALAAALMPAREASRVAPVEAMARGRGDYNVRVHKWRDLWFALAFAVAAAAAARMPAVAGKPLFGYLSAVLFIAASALAVPAMVDFLTRFSLQRVFGIEAKLAARGLAASLGRTSVLVGALSTAIAMMTSVGIMVGSFRETVIVWMDERMRADLYMRPAGSPAGDQHPVMDPAIPAAIERLPSVEGVDRFRAYEISVNGLPATLGAGDLRIYGRYAKSRSLTGRSNTEIAALLRGRDAAIVSEPFANKHGVGVGGRISLPLGTKTVSFEVVDVYSDYANERGYIIVDRDTLLRYLPSESASNLAIYLKPGVDLEEGRREVIRATAGKRVVVFANRALREEAVRIFDRTFAITYALEAVAIVVAVMGIAGALLALVIDRRREFALLRFLGASIPQVRKLILFEAGLIGLLSNIAGLALGAVLSLLLILVINKQSFGWTIQIHSPALILIGALSGVYVATILTGLYPARAAAKMNPIEVIHEE